MNQMLLPSNKLPWALVLGIAVGTSFVLSMDPLEAALILQNNVGMGADAPLGNDSGFASTSNGGGSTSMEIRAGDSGTNRNRLGIVRWDISSAAGDLSGAIMRFYETGNNSRTVTVYGLNDGDLGEMWDEGTITYDTAPAISLNAGPPVSTDFDPARTTDLGTFGTTGSTAESLQFSSAALDSFLAADTDGLVTFYLYRAGGGSVTVRSKEFDYTGTIGNPPTLELPNASAIPEPLSGSLLAIGAAALAAKRRSRSASAQY